MKFVPIGRVDVVDMDGVPYRMDEYEYDVKVVDRQTFHVGNIRFDYSFHVKHDGIKLDGYFIMMRDERRLCDAMNVIEPDVFDWQECPRAEFLMRVFRREDTVFR